MYDPALYTKANNLQRRDVGDFSDEFVDEIGKMSGRCLDIGSGPGDTLVDFVLPKMNTAATVVCSDISERMVNFAKEKYKNNGRLSFAKLNIETPNLPEDLVGQFDHATSFYCLNWCQDMGQAFKNIFNLLRPGGSTLLTFVASFPPLNAFTTLAAIPRYQPYMKDAHRYISVFQHSKAPRETLRILLKDVGFDIRHCSMRTKTYIFKTREDLKKFMLALSPFRERMPADLREEYSKDLAQATARESIVFNKINNNEDEHSTLFIYHVFLVSLRKPLTN